MGIVIDRHYTSRILPEDNGLQHTMASRALALNQYNVAVVYDPHKEHTGHAEPNFVKS